MTPFSPIFSQIPCENIYKQVQQMYVKKRMVTETEKHIKPHDDAIIHICWNESWNFVLRCNTFFIKFWQMLHENIYKREHFFKYCIILESIASLVPEDFTLLKF